MGKGGKAAKQHRVAAPAPAQSAGREAQGSDAAGKIKSEDCSQYLVSCIFTPGDGTGDSEEQVATVATQELCESYILANHADANGATWSPGENKCYAEYGMSGQSQDPDYVTCILAKGSQNYKLTTQTTLAATSLYANCQERNAQSQSTDRDVQDAAAAAPPGKGKGKGAKSAKEGKHPAGQQAGQLAARGTSVGLEQAAKSPRVGMSHYGKGSKAQQTREDAADRQAADAEARQVADEEARLVAADEEARLAAADEEARQAADRQPMTAAPTPQKEVATVETTPTKKKETTIAAAATNTQKKTEMTTTTTKTTMKKTTTTTVTTATTVTERTTTTSTSTSESTSRTSTSTTYTRTVQPVDPRTIDPVQVKKNASLPCKHSFSCRVMNCASSARQAGARCSSAAKCLN